jgi:hypothetical protein
MFDSWGFGVYFFFASLMLISVPFVFFLIPETKSVPLEVMDRLFKIKPVWRANKVIMDELSREGRGFREDADVVNLRDEKAAVDELERGSKEGRAT